MKLKSIQIAGFKSFANKTKIDFQNGFTGVVGPNGSGKSNVIEAVRWALGEQSAKSLRGNKMKDIIFSGSKNQQPLNRAQVSLVFDNTSHFLDSEYTEVKVTRTYYRNGESIYSINDQECLLRDIHNLFMDTGLGEGSLSIISQGNVDDILANDVQKRRSIIETAAGVYHYKKQKGESEKKLEDTQMNLNRITDVIREIEKQMNPLKEQSETASLYLNKNKRLDELKFNKLNHLLEQYTHSKQQIQTHLQTTQAKHQALLNQFDELKVNKEKINQQLNDLNQQKEHLQQKLLQNNKTLEDLSSKKRLNEQQKSFNLQKQAELNQQLGGLTQKANLIQQQLTDEEQTQQRLVQQLIDLKTKNKSLKVQEWDNQVKKTEQQLEHNRTTYVELMQSISDARNNLRMVEKLNQQADSNSKMLFQELNQKKQQLQKIQQTIAGITDELNQLKLENQNLNQKSQTLDDAIEKDEAEVEAKRNHWLDAMRIFQEAKTERDSLASLLENHNNLYRGTRSLLKQKDKLSGIIGTVGDYLNVDSQYISAIEVALGGAIQQLMVETIADARAAINYLNQNRLGRVTLLPINDITERFVSHDVLSLVQQVEGFVGIAADLVQIDSQYQRVKQHLLGGILVADSLKAATKISKVTHHKVKVVSLSGDVVNAGGSITGGKNQRQNDGLLSQKNNLKHLNLQVQRMQAKLNLGEQNVKNSQLKLKNDQEAKQKLYQNGSDISAKLALAKNNLALQEQESNKVERAIKAIDLKLGNHLSEGNESPAELRSRVTKLETQIQENQRQNQTLINDLEKVKRNYNAERSVQSDLIQKIGIMQERLTNVKQRCSNLKADYAHNTQQQQTIAQELQVIADQLIEIKEISQADTQTLQQQIDKIESDFSKAKSTFATSQLQLQQVETKISQTQQLLITNSEEVHRLESDENLIQQKLTDTNHKLANLKADQQVYQKLDLSLADLNTEITKVQQQISQLGPVNLGAIEAYQTLKQRYEFMHHQIDDLEMAKKQLLEIMNKMDEQVKVRFKQTYVKVAESFSKVFRNIFGGGEAKLELSDPKHLLTTGIDILVKPPGKRYRNINLLSGGEKALTALALLFAIIEVKPVPFVILDEAESALDPANVDRFARYIESLKQETQFIVVTHRKETMIYADNLFGITMQDSGISKLVSVDLSDRKRR